MSRPLSESDPAADGPDQRELRLTVRRVIDDVSPPHRIAALDEAEAFDDALFDALADVGVLAIGAPSAVGGAGGLRDQLVVVDELGAGPTSMAAFMIAEYAALQVLASFGHTHHRDIAAAAAQGSAKLAFALSEPGGGTDVARAMQTRAVTGDGGGYRLSGAKLWTSGASIADWLIVFARTAPPERSPADGITMFLVPPHAPGVEISTVATFGMRGIPTCEIRLDDVGVPDDSVIGEPGKGLRHAFSAIDRESLLAAAATVGVGRAALEMAVGYARERHVFDAPIGSFQVPQHWLVDGAVQLEAARSLMARAVETELGGGDAGALAAMAKLVASEAAVEISLRGMQLMGGMGYTRDMAMQRYFRDGRLWSFSPLTNEMVRNRIGETVLGLPRSY